METDDEAQLVLTKWPFYLGDVLLVLIALAIAILGDWQLTDWQVVACVLSVALGAGLFVLPFILEFYARAQEDSEGRASELHIFKRQVQAAEDSVERAAVRMHQLEETLAAQVKSTGVFSNLMDGKFETLDARLADVVEQLVSLTGVVAKIPEPEVREDLLQVVRPVISDLESQLRGLVSKSELQELVERLQQIEQALASVPASSGEGEPISENSELVERSKRKRRQVEPRLLRRAIDGGQAASSSAVSRIIDQRVELAEDVVGVPEANVVKDVPDLVDLEEPAEFVAPEVEMVKATEDLVQSEGDANECVAQSADIEPLAEVSIPEPEVDMFAEAVAVVEKRRVRKNKADSVVTASILIGIGNKPYLRGSGAGLNWEQGVVMDFEEIGRWGWVAPVDLEGPIEFQIFCNDEQPDRKGKYTLEPGQKLEVTPVF